MSATFQYAQLHLRQDPGSSSGVVSGWLKLPGQEEWTKLGEVTNLLKFVNRLGAEGWEMIGPPITQNSVFTYQAANETWHDRASWIEREYWFKKEAP